MKKIKYFILPIVIGVSFSFILNSFLSSSIDKMLSNNDLKPILYNADSMIKNKGYYANNYLSDKDYILMFGSSELGHSTLQHPDYYFNSGKTKHGMLAIGKAYTQNLQHATVLGSIDKPNKNVVLLLSMQWFMDKEGVTEQHFQGRFSPIQFYKFMDNKNIKDNTKILYANRVVQLLKTSNEFQTERLYAINYLKNHDSSQKFSNITDIFKPFFYFRKYMVNLKDKGLLFEELIMTSRKEKKSLKDNKFDWRLERDMAHRDAIKRVGKKKHILGGKRLYIDKGYFKKNLYGKDKFFLNKYKDINLTESKEYEDLNIFLETCKDLNIKPVILLTPSMESFYSYTGITKEKREKYYEKIRNLNASYDFTMIDLTEYDTSQYYLRDVMHIGTIGWVDICERLYNIFEK